MPKELYKLYKTYNKDKIDNSFIEYAFELLLKDDKDLVNKYINNLLIEDTNNHYIGTYSNETKDVTINKNKILNDNNIMHQKILTIQTLKHEIEHARNLKILYNRKKDIQSTVIEYSLIEYALYTGLISKEKSELIRLIVLNRNKIDTYDLNPGERIVEIKAWKYMVNLLKNQRRTEDLLLARSMLYYSYIRGYENNGYYLNAPTYEYLLQLELFKEYKQLKERVEKKNYSFETRIMNGLPLNDKEFDIETLKKVKLQKKNKR